MHTHADTHTHARTHTHTHNDDRAMQPKKSSMTHQSNSDLLITVINFFSPSLHFSSSDSPSSVAFKSPTCRHRLHRVTQSRRWHQSFYSFIQPFFHVLIVISLCVDSVKRLRSNYRAHSCGRRRQEAPTTQQQQHNNNNTTPTTTTTTTTNYILFPLKLD